MATCSNRFYFLLVTDEYSRFPLVEIVTTTAADKAIPLFGKIFVTHFIPAKVKSDNGPPFNGEDMTMYAQQRGFCHEKFHLHNQAAMAWRKGKIHDMEYIDTCYHTEPHHTAPQEKPLQNCFSIDNLEHMFQSSSPEAALINLPKVMMHKRKTKSRNTMTRSVMLKQLWSKWVTRS